jgi:DNA processing protein
MNYLALLNFIQKNIRMIQNYRHLCESILPFQSSFEGLCDYLRDEEHFFYAHLWENKDAFQKDIDELTRLKMLGVQFTFPGDSLYPASFLQMPGAPLLFSFKGHPCWLLGRSLAVVGSRDATRLSHNWMESALGEFLQLEKAVIISGGARGVDQMAHQLALRHDCPTIVVLPSGLGQIYPSLLGSWQNRIIDGGGCLMSEYPYQQIMKKHFFHDRNRLIAGLGAMTLLVEGRRRSGSLLTAQKTLELGKSVLVVPGHPSDNSHLGNLDLLSEGATPVRDAHDLRSIFQDELKLPPAPSPIASEKMVF